MKFLGIKTKIIVLTGLLLVAAISTSLIVSLYYLKEAHSEDISEFFDRTESVIESLFAAHKRKLRNETQLLGQLPELRQALSSKTGNELQGVVSDFVTELGIDVLDVIDPQGKQVGHAIHTDYAHLQAISKRHESYAALLASARRGQFFASFIVFGENLAMAASAPIGEKQSGLGTLIAIKLLDKRFAEHIQELTGTDVLFSFFDQRVLATSLPQEFAASLEAKLVHHIFAYEEQTTIPEGIFYAKVLNDHLQRGIGQVAVLLSVADMDATISNIIWVIIAFGLLIMGLALLLSGVTGEALTRKLLTVISATKRIAKGDFATKLAVDTSDEVGDLAQAVNNMSEQIVELLAKEKSRVAYEKELETASTVQATLFSEPITHSPPFHIAAYYTPATRVGGDWWGQYEIASGVRLVIVADATGHGVPAALITAIAYSTSVIYADWLRKGDAKLWHNPALILKALNNTLSTALAGKFCMSFFAAVLDSNCGKLSYANGGHNFPYLLPKSTDDPRLSRSRNQNTPIPLTYQGPNRGSLLGLSTATTFANNTVELRAKDRLVFFTDGLIEAESPEGIAWGSRRFLKSIVKHQDGDVKQLRDGIIADLEAFHRRSRYDDDVTLVVVEHSHAPYSSSH